MKKYIKTFEGFDDEKQRKKDLKIEKERVARMESERNAVDVTPYREELGLGSKVYFFKNPRDGKGGNRDLITIDITAYNNYEDRKSALDGKVTTRHSYTRSITKDRFDIIKHLFNSDQINVETEYDIDDDEDIFFDGTGRGETDETIKKEWWDKNYKSLIDIAFELKYDDLLNILDGDENLAMMSSEMSSKQKAYFLLDEVPIEILDGLIQY